MSAPPRVLIAGIGNVLRGDDAFGVHALGLLRQELGERPGVVFFESGIAGIALVQQLLDGYDALVMLDAVDRGAAPGTVFVLAPDREAIAAAQVASGRVDLHQAGPEGVLRLAAALGVLPLRAWIVGCQASDCDELGADLCPEVAAALPSAAAKVHQLLDLVTARAGREEEVRARA